jgi:hypothetical protein
MATITFKLTNKEDFNEIVEKTTLVDMWKHIHIHINEPRNWIIEECEDGEMNDCICAYTFISMYKDENDVPKLISDILP